MNRRAALIALVAGNTFAQRQKTAKQTKGPEVELLDSSARVEGRRVLVDCRVKNVAERPIRKLTVIIEVLDTDGRVLTRQQGPIETPVLGPGEESLFQAQIAYHARTHSFRLSFEDGSGRELRAEDTGPFPVE